jgi:hypothetical protein
VIDEVDYAGPAVLHAGDVVRRVEVRLAGRFEPADGRFHWGGRIAADPGVAQLVRDGHRQATLSVDDRPPVPARLGEVDPWGGVRIHATGRPPWPVDVPPPA